MAESCYTTVPVFRIAPLMSNLTADTVTAVARLHYELIGRTGSGSLASLGVRYLERVFYGANLANPHFFCDFARVGNEVVAFSVYTDNRSKLLCRSFAIRTALHALTHPWRVPLLARTMLDGKPPAGARNVAGQWIVAAIRPEHRGSGIADALVKSMEERLRGVHCKDWLGVARLDPPINKVLLRHGAQFIGTGQTQGAMFNYYVKQL